MDFKSKTIRSRRLAGHAGFVLMEIMLALIIFSISVLGLVNQLNETLGVSNRLHRAQVIRAGLESILSEARQRDELDEMKLDTTDARTGINYRTEVDEMRLPNENGEDLDNLYVLRATATYQEDGQEKQEKAEVYINLSKETETPATGEPAAAGDGTYANANAQQQGNANAGGNRGGRGNRGGGGNGGNTNAQGNNSNRGGTPNGGGGRGGNPNGGGGRNNGTRGPTSGTNAPSPR